MKYLSLFSGIETATVAWHPLGWTPVGFAEVEPFPCAVLELRSLNWHRGDESKKRCVRKLIESQRRLEMKARKSGRGITPTFMKEALANRVVESGNRRFSAIRKAYRNHPERAKAYREHLKQNAEAFGLKPEVVDNFNQPVLVRQRQEKMDADQRIAFTKEANVRSVFAHNHPSAK